MLAFAFEEDYFTTVPLKDPGTGEAILKPGRQLVVDLLLKVMMTSKHFTAAQVSYHRLALSLAVSLCSVRGHSRMLHIVGVLRTDQFSDQL